MAIGFMKKGLSKKPTVESYHFLPRKYGRDLLLDIGRIESLKNFITDDRPHQISFYEILFIEKGSGWFYLDENKMPIRTGAVIFTSPGQVRRWKLTKSATGYTLFFEKDFLNLFFVDEFFLYRFQFFHQYKSPTGFLLSKKEYTAIHSLFNTIDDEFHQLQHDSNHLIRAILYQLLVLLNRSYAAAYQLQNNTQVHPDFLRFRLLLEREYIQLRLVADYTKCLGVSTVQLNKLCRQYAGLSAQQMIHHKLLYEVKKQLRSSRSMKEIAYQFNFSDPSNFTRFFKKLADVTPQQYRNGL
jgi:AraC-like DNA-binding protein